MPPSTSNTEIARRLAALETKIDQLPRDLDKTYVRQKEAESNERTILVQLTGLEREIRALRDEIKEFDDRLATEIGKIDERLRWAFRTAVGALFLPVVVAVIVYLFLGQS